MKATCSDFEAKRSSGFTALPPVGAYVAEIQAVRVLDPQKDKSVQRITIELFMEIIEGEYANRFHEVYEDQKERFGDTAKYKGIFRLIPYTDDDEDWRKRNFQSNVWCVQESNPGYKWDWDEKKLKGKKVGISLRKRLYTYTNAAGEEKNGETIEIARFETVDDVRNGKCKPMRDRDQRKNKEEQAEESTDGSSFTEVTNEVNVPW